MVLVLPHSLGVTAAGAMMVGVPLPPMTMGA
jgi:hypothetical protein